MIKYLCIEKDKDGLHVFLAENAPKGFETKTPIELDDECCIEDDPNKSVRIKIRISDLTKVGKREL